MLDKKKMIRMSEQDEKNIIAMAKATGLSGSDVIRRLIPSEIATQAISERIGVRCNSSHRSADERMEEFGRLFEIEDLIERQFRAEMMLEMQSNPDHPLRWQVERLNNFDAVSAMYVEYKKAERGEEGYRFVKATTDDGKTEWFVQKDQKAAAKHAKRVEAEKAARAKKADE